jgi:malate permease and related proteins
MNSFATVLNAVLPVFAIMGAGLLIRRLNWLTEEADHSLLRVVVNVLMPCLILDTALGNPALHDWRNLALAPLIGIVTVLLGVALAWWVARPCRLAPGPAQRTFAVTTGLYNYGYIPLPLTVLLFDDRTTSVLFLHNTGVEACVWTVLTLILTGGHGARDWRKLFNAPLLAIGLALALNFSGADAQLPAVLRHVIHLLGVCAFPIALLLVGATIADQLGELRPGAAWGPVLPALVLRLGLLPVLFLALAKLLPLSVELKRVLVLEAAMPAAVVPIVLARHYGGDPALALRIVLGTSVVSLLTTPLWIGFGLKWLGLG